MSDLPAFVVESHPRRVVFGCGAVAKIGEEAARLGLERALVIASSKLASLASTSLGARAAGVHTDVVMHVPLETARKAGAAAAEVNADGFVVIGGGSAIGLAKILARDTGLPILAVPTTYAGSEMTSIWGLTEQGKKRTGRDAKVRPRTVLYDPELTLSMPAMLSATSGLNAIAHSMEALYAAGADPMTLLMAEESVRALASALPRVAASPTDLGARADALYGAWLAGACLDRAAMGVHHKLCHVLGGSFDLPHALVHAVILPHAAAYNRDAAKEGMRRLSRALGEDDVPTALFDLAARLHAPASLAEIGMKEPDLDRAAILATENAYANPRPVDRAGIRALLEDAFLGRRPTGGISAPA